MELQAKVNTTMNGRIHIRFTQNNDKIKVNKESPLQKIKPYFSKLVGMNDMIKVMEELYAVHLVNDLRAGRGLQVNSQGNHMVFTGNPGTGKTTVARIVATILKDLEILPKGQLIECDRASLVGEYIGETAQKMSRMIDKAIGGVLFIDEAYALARGGEKDFGREAIDHLVKRMEDDRDELVIIIAGYPEEMKHFLSMNPGLSSRFTHHISFANYTVDELLQICERMFKQNEYFLTNRAKEYLYDYLKKATMRNDKQFANGRFARNIVEKAMRKQAVRVISDSYQTDRTLMEIQTRDFV